MLTTWVEYPSVVPHLGIISATCPMLCHLKVWRLSFFCFFPAVSDVVLAFPFEASRRPRAASSRGSSRVSMFAQALANRRTEVPTLVVAWSSILTVVSVCSRSFASACHTARSHKRSKTILSSGVGNNPSIQGMMH